MLPFGVMPPGEFRPHAAERRLELPDTKPGDSVFPAPPAEITGFDPLLALQPVEEGDGPFARDAAIEGQAGKHIEQGPPDVGDQIGLLDQLEQRIGIIVPDAEQQPRQAGGNMIGKQPLEIALGLPGNRQQMTAQLGVPRGRKYVQTIEENRLFLRQQENATTKLVGDRVHGRCQLIGPGKASLQSRQGRSIRRPERGRDLVGGHAMLRLNSQSGCRPS